MEIALAEFWRSARILLASFALSKPVSSSRTYDSDEPTALVRDDQTGAFLETLRLELVFQKA